MIDSKLESSSTEAIGSNSAEKSSVSDSGLLFGVPLDVVVRGGTTSYAHDQLMAQQRAEDEARRRESDEDKRLAARQASPGDVAKMHSMNLGTPTTSPVVLDCQIAQMHIWKGALTEQQRTNVTNYLKEISGIA